MINFEKIDLNELKNIIYLCYKDDTELIDSYHSINIISKNNSLEDCVEMTYDRICDTDSLYGMENYAVKSDGSVIGYISKLDNLLYSFAIIKEFRRKEVLNLWWEKVTELFEGEIVAMIYNNNTRCSRFFEKNKMQLIAQEDNILIYKN